MQVPDTLRAISWIPAARSNGLWKAPIFRWVFCRNTNSAAAIRSSLEPGEILALLTDGITEAERPDQSCLRRRTGSRVHPGASPGKRSGNRERALSRRSGIFPTGLPQIDDITAVICKATEQSKRICIVASDERCAATKGELNAERKSCRNHRRGKYGRSPDPRSDPIRQGQKNRYHRQRCKPGPAEPICQKPTASEPPPPTWNWSRNASIVIIAVKPQNIDDLLDELSTSSHEGHLFISIAAGITTEKLAAKMHHQVRDHPGHAQCAGIRAGRHRGPLSRDGMFRPPTSSAPFPFSNASAAR